MIKTFKHKGLKLFWESGNAKQLPQHLIVKENWRIIFRFDEESVYDVNLVDYH